MTELQGVTKVWLKAAVTLVAALLMLAAARAHAETFAFSYSFRLTQPDGSPLNEPLDVEVSFYDVPVGGDKRGGSPYQFASVIPRDGVIQLDFTFSGADTAAIFTDAAAETWIEITDRTHGQTYPRQRFSTVPYALRTPVDDATLGYDATGELAVRSIPASAVTGLSDALASKAGTNQTVSGDVTGSLTATVVSKLQGVGVSTNAPTAGQVLTYNGGEWRPQSFTVSSGVPVHVLGSGDQTASPVDGTLRAADAVGTDAQGADLSIAAGNGTGAGGSGSILFQTADVGASGSGADTLTTRLTITPSGNVGIGTTQPAGPLDVNGKLTVFSDGKVAIGTTVAGKALVIQQATQFGGIRIKNATNTLIDLIGTTADNENARLNLNASGATKVTLNASGASFFTGGNVGIGTAAPTSQLSVAGDTDITGNLLVNGTIRSSTGGFTFSDGTTMTSAAPTPSSGYTSTTDLGFSADSGANGTGILTMSTHGAERLRITNSGNIGIGTSAPSSALEVNGTITATAIAAPVSGNLGLNVGAGNVGVGTSSPMSKLDVNGNASIGSAYVGVHAAPSDGLLVAGNVGIGTHSPSERLEVAGVVKSTSGGFMFPDGTTMTTAAAAGTAGTSSTTDLNLAADTGATGTGAMILSTGGSERARITNGGNVGIGTTSPGAHLEVNAAGAEIRVANQSATSYAQIKANTTNQLLINKVTTVSGGALIDLNPSPIDAVPSTQPASVRLFRNTNTTGAVGLSILKGNNSTSTNAFISGNGNSYLSAITGNVGIGTTSPSAPLDVASSVNGIAVRAGNQSSAFTSNQLLLGYQGTNSFRHALKTRHNGGDARGNAYDFYVWGYGTDFASAVGTKHVMTLDGTGNVGIGTTDPAQALEVVGAIKTTGGIVFPDGTTMTTAAAASTGSSSTSDLNFAADSDASGSGAISLSTAGSDRLHIDNSGNVGIGSATPGGLLDVAGDLVVSSSGNVGIGTTNPSGALEVSRPRSDTPGDGHLVFSTLGTSLFAWRHPFSANRLTLDRSWSGSWYEVLSVDRQNGNVGIGTTSPTKLFDLSAGASGSLTEQLVLRNAGATASTGTGAGLAFALSSSSASRHAAIDAVVSNSASGASDLLLSTHNGSTVTEKIRIKAGGSVGIGTSSPANKLSVDGSADFTGNVGIGTALPTQTLDVAGAIRSSSGGFIFPDGTTMTTAVAPGGGSTTSTGDLPFAADTTASGSGDVSFATAGAERLRITNGGNTGIATATPKSKLDVAGGVAIGAYAGVTSAPSNGLVVSGNVGIGTSSPAGILHVAGATSIFGAGEGSTPSASTIRGPNASGSNIAGANLTVQASNGTGSGGSGSILFQTAPTAASGSTANTLATQMAILPSGNVGVGTTAASSKLQVNGGAAIGYGTATAAPTNGLAVLGNVGIGTATATEVLEVAGRIKSTSGGFVFPDGSVMTTAAATSTGDTSATDLTFAADSDVNGSGAVSVSTGGVERLSVANGGNVGIGTSSPAGLLHVAGATSIFGAGEGATPSATRIRGANAAGTNVAGANLTIQAGNGTGTAGSGSILFQTADAGASGASANTLATRMAILPSGNVGIGTTTPSEAFTLYGSSAAALRNYVQNTNSNGWAEFRATSDVGELKLGVGGSGLGGLGGGGAAYLTTIGAFSLKLATNNTERVRIDAGGNVGIGSTSPTEKLDVAGSIRSSSGGFVFPDGSVMTTAVTSTTGGATSTTDLNLAADTGATGSGAILLLTAAQERMRIDNSGKVGIGTATPLSALDVVGGVALGSYAGTTAAASNTLIMGGKIGVGLSTVNNTVDIAGAARSGTHATTAPLYVTGNFSLASSGVEFRHTNGTLGIGFGTTSIYQAGSSANANLNLIPKGTGNVGIGTTSPAGLLDVKGLLTVLSGGNVGIGTTTPGYKLHVNGAVAGVGSFTQLSDERYKKDVRTLSGSLAKLMELRGVSYKWLDGQAYGDSTQLGVIAQEIEKVVPEIVETGEDGVKRVKYSDLIPLVIEAFKEERAAKSAEIAQLHAAGAETAAKLAQAAAQAEEAAAQAAALRDFLCAKFPDAPHCADQD